MYYRIKSGIRELIERYTGVSISKKRDGNDVIMDHTGEYFLDRSQGWEDPQFELVNTPPKYSHRTITGVRYVPVILRGSLIGYLWASTDDSEDSADYLHRADSDIEGVNAGSSWEWRMLHAKDDGLTPIGFIRRWVGEPEDPKAGGVPADAEEKEAPSLHELKVIAGWPDGQVTLPGIGPID